MFRYDSSQKGGRRRRCVVCRETEEPLQMFSALRGYCATIITPHLPPVRAQVAAQKTESSKAGNPSLLRKSPSNCSLDLSSDQLKSKESSEHPPHTRRSKAAQRDGNNKFDRCAAMICMASFSFPISKNLVCAYNDIHSMHAALHMFYINKQ